MLASAGRCAGGSRPRWGGSMSFRFAARIGLILLVAGRLSMATAAARADDAQSAAGATNADDAKMADTPPERPPIVPMPPRPPIVQPRSTGPQTPNAPAPGRPN